MAWPDTPLTDADLAGPLQTLFEAVRVTSLLGYTPSLGSGWTLGNGTLDGKYLRIGPNLVVARVQLTFGSTTVLANGNSGFGVPVPLPAGSTVLFSTVEYFDASAGAYYHGRASTLTSSTQVFAAYGSGTAAAIRQSDTVPVAKGTGDTLTLWFAYLGAS